MNPHLQSLKSLHTISQIARSIIFGYREIIQLLDLFEFWIWAITISLFLYQGEVIGST